jgi:hypothetical protein
MDRRVSVVLIVAAVLAALLVGCKAGDASACAGQPTRQVEVTSAAAQSLSDKIGGTTAGQPFRIQATEQEVTSYVALQLSGSPVSDATFWFTSDKAYLQGQVDFGGQHKLQWAFALQVADGKLSIKLLCATLDGTAMPDVALGTLQGVLNSTLSKYASKVQWEQAQMAEGSVTVAGKSQ